MYKTNQHNPMLSAHFDLFALCASETAEALGIDNLPKQEDVRPNLSALCQNILDPIVDHFDLPLTVTSGFRCAALNKAVGGLENSQHLLGEAADIMVGGLRNDELAQWIADHLDFDELILEKFDPNSAQYGWVHVSYSRTLNRKKEMTFDGQSFHQGLHHLDLSHLD